MQYSLVRIRAHDINSNTQSLKNKRYLHENEKNYNSNPFDINKKYDIRGKLSISLDMLILLSP